MSLSVARVAVSPARVWPVAANDPAATSDPTTTAGADRVTPAVRIAALLPVAPSQLAATWVQVVGLVLATLIPPMAFAAASIGEAGHVAWHQLPAVLFHVPVLLVSGYHEGDLLSRLADAGPLAFLSKPFTRDALERKLREFLDEKPDA